MKPTLYSPGTPASHGQARPAFANDVWRGTDLAGVHSDISKQPGLSRSDPVAVSSDAERIITNDSTRGDLGGRVAERPLIATVDGVARRDYGGMAHAQEIGIMPQMTPT
jgi:hypothetical protein